MNILVVNAGSTTVKFKLFDGSLSEKLKGIIDKKADTTEIKLEDIDKIGFRVVHGGEKFIQPVKITAEIISKIKELTRLAPLHNPPALKVINDFKQQLPGKDMFAVFDTAFHADIPKHAAIYAIPYKYYEENQIRRYGFHGTSHKYVSGIFRELEPKTGKLISCHLGGGASITAVKDGKSIDTSMGFTPLEGLVMASRSGDIDAGVILHLQIQMQMDADAVSTLLNKQSGLLGLSGSTGKTGNRRLHL